MKLQIHNFQSIQDAEIEVEGLTTLTGESSNGKSAVLRATRAVLTNPSGTHCIRKGSLECSVAIENEGHQAQWVKTSGQTLYRVDGEEFSKLNRSVPEQVQSLGFGELVVGHDTFHPQIFRQFDKPFILSEASPSTIAELLASSKDSQQIARANKIAQDELRQRSSEAKVLDEQIKGQLTLLKSLGESSKFLEEYRRRVNHSSAVYLEARDKLEKMKAVLESWKRAQLVQKETTISAQLPVGVVDDGGVQNWVSVFSRYRRFSRALQVSLPVALGEFPVDAVDKAQRTRHLVSRYTASSRRAGLVLPDLAGALVGKELEGITRLKSIRDTQRKTFKSRDQAMSDLNTIVKDIKQNEHDNSKILQVLGYCPICSPRKF